MHVARLGWTPVRGTRWLTPARLDIDTEGVRGDRAWSAVDADLDAVRAAKHPEMMRHAVEDADLPTAPGSSASTDEHEVQVTYWGRPMPASLHDGPLAARLSDCTGLPVRLAHTRKPGGFIWGAPVSVLFASELADLPHEPPVEVDRYRANVLVDDSDAPLAVAPGMVLDADGVRLRVVEPIDRCIVIDHHPVTGQRDQRLMGRLRPGALLGWGCEVEVPGSLHVDATVGIA